MPEVGILERHKSDLPNTLFQGMVELIKKDSERGFGDLL